MKHPIDHLSIEITNEEGFRYGYMYIHRNKVSRHYGWFWYWPEDRKARRLLRFFRLTNAFAKRMMGVEK
jgi:hypothetical protein